MIIERDVLTHLGPGKVVYNSGTEHWSAGDITVEIVTELADVDSDQHSHGVKTVLDQKVVVKYRPQSLWALLDLFYAADYVNPSKGARLIGATAKPLVIHGEDGSLFTVHNAALTGLPSVKLGVDSGEFGDVEFTGVITDAKQVGESAALFTYAGSGGTFGSPAAADYLAAANWEAGWNSAALGGTLLDAVTITPDYKVEAIKAGPTTIDFRAMGVQFSADLRAAWDPADLQALINDAATYVRGARNTAGAADLVLTSGLGHTFTLSAAFPEKGSLLYAMKDIRSNPITFRTTGRSAARVSWTTPV